MVRHIPRVGLRAAALSLLGATWVVAAVTGFSPAPSWVALIAAFLCLPAAAVGTVRPWRRGRRTVLTALACLLLLYVSYCGYVAWRTRNVSAQDALGYSLWFPVLPGSSWAASQWALDWTAADLLVPDYWAQGHSLGNWLVGCERRNVWLEPAGPLAWDVGQTDQDNCAAEFSWACTRVDFFGRAVGSCPGPSNLDVEAHSGP